MTDNHRNLLRFMMISKNISSAYGGHDRRCGRFFELLAIRSLFETLRICPPGQNGKCDGSLRSSSPATRDRLNDGVNRHAEVRARSNALDSKCEFAHFALICMAPHRNHNWLSFKHLWAFPLQRSTAGKAVSASRSAHKRRQSPLLRGKQVSRSKQMIPHQCPNCAARVAGPPCRQRSLWNKCYGTRRARSAVRKTPPSSKTICCRCCS
jgi:hypothetical protein